LLSDGSEVNIETPWNQPDNRDDAFLNLNPGCLPDENDTVIEIDLAE